MIKRDIQKEIEEAATGFGVVSITGPRQSGKTTLCKVMFPSYKYVNLENPAVLERIMYDPEGFLAGIEGGVIIDEIQKYPELLSFIQVSVDADYRPGKFIITGSQNLLLSDKISQSLAGRVAVITLLPLTSNELLTQNYLADNIESIILDGFYPGKFTRNIKRTLFYSSYLETYIERDVRELKNITSLTDFKRFLSVLAGRVGQLLNTSNIANDIGVTNKTIESWISILEASYIIFRLPPYFVNHGKRLIKSPKIFFHDTGLACYLLGIDSKSEFETHYARGTLFENFIVSEMLKSKFNKISSSNLYFWRDRKGHEIDLLIATGSSPILVEIKAGATYSSDYIKHLEYYKNLSLKDNKSYVVYTGDKQAVVKQNQIINWKDIDIIKSKL